MKNKRKRDRYIAFHWKRISQWLNQCVSCQQSGYKPELPDSLGPGVLAVYLRQYYQPLKLNERGLCDQCANSLANRSEAAQS